MTPAKRPRRGRGEGGIRQRPDDRWEGSIDLGWANGNRQRKFVYGRTKSEALEKLRVLQTQLAAGLPMSDERITVEKWLDHWLANVLPGSVKATTVGNYTALVDVHLRPTLGKHRLTKLEVRHVEDLLANMTRAGYKPNTIRLVRSVLRRALGHAVRQGLVLRNVAALANGPRIPRGESPVLTPAQARDLMLAGRGHRYEVGVVLLVETGMRVGELLGLRWGDIDLEAGRLQICQTLSTLGGRIIVDEPKTASSRRPYELSPQAVEALRAHRIRQAAERLAMGPHWTQSGHVLVTELGTPVDPSNFRRRFKQIARAAGLPECHPHQLRHTAASLMLARGVPLHIVADVLGHSSISVTKDVYGHLVAGERRLATDAMSRALYGGA